MNDYRVEVFLDTRGVVDRTAVPVFPRKIEWFIVTAGGLDDARKIAKCEAMRRTGGALVACSVRTDGAITVTVAGR